MNKKLLIPLFIVAVSLLSLALINNSKDTPKPPTNLSIENLPSNPEDLKTALVAGGCFWCVEADLEKLPGVISAVSGYAGGSTDNPTYDNYSKNGHREVVEVTYDSTRLSLAEIVIYSIKHMDPTDAEGSFFDRGAGYAPAMYYESPEEKEVIESIIASIDQNGPYEKPLAVLVLERPTFWAAEDFHQDYYKGSLSSVKYQYYRKGSGRDAFIEKYWGKDTGPNLPWQTEVEPISLSNDSMTTDWKNYQKPNQEILKAKLDELAYKVTQEEGTERAGTSPLDKEYGRGIYVDILSGEPLFSSKDKYDSGTGWPSFTAPISKEAVTEHIDKKLFSTRTEIRSAIADNHLGHVFLDGPRDSTGLRYCMNGVALRFVPEAEMEAAGYSEWLGSL